MFGKSLNELIEKNCSDCIHRDICNKAIRLEIWDGNCQQKLEGGVVYHGTYDIRLKVGDEAYIIDGDASEMLPKRVRVEEIIIKKNGTVCYYIPGIVRQFKFNQDIFKDKKHCLNHIEFLKTDGGF